MVAIERGECVWTDRGLCYYGGAPASGPRLCGAQCECLHRGAGPAPVNQMKKHRDTLLVQRSDRSCGSDG